MTALSIPPGAWNCHMHCFDPERHPFKANRAYTPEPARANELVRNALTDKIMLVQATIENGYAGLLENMKLCRDSHPDKNVFGTIFWDVESEPKSSLGTLTDPQFDELHDAGVRSVRIHGSYGGSGEDLDWVRKQFLDVARRCPVRRHNWSISAQLPLATWSSLADTLLSHPILEGVSIIADHNGCATTSDISSAELSSFIRLLQSGRFYVKIGALHRRSPADITLMRPVIEAFADSAPHAILWGSDWPHCNASIRGLKPTRPLEVDTNAELTALQEWLTPEQIPTGQLEEVDKQTGEEVENAPTKNPTLMDTYRSYSPEFSKETEKRLLRKIDTHLLPLLVTIYLFNYLDRNSITQARLYGLQEDTHVKGATYQTAISIFSVGYIAMQLPSTLLMTKVQPHIFLPGCIIIWAFVSGCTSATSSPAGLLTIRFFLGIVEAPFFPGAIYYMSCWYTKKELGLRMALLVCGLLLSNCFAGLISAGILSGMAGVGHLAAWRWLFILEGLATMVVGVVAFFMLPDYPGTTKWLSEEEKVVAQGRLAADAGSEEVLGEDEISMKQAIFAALGDYRVWLFACLQMSTTASISFSHFFPTLIQQLGFKNNTIVLLLTAPPYLFSFIWALSFAWDADRRQKRSPHASISAIMAIAGTVSLVAMGDQRWPRYAMTFLVCAGTFGIYSTTYPWLSSTIVQPAVKRAAAIGIANTLANSASLFANYFWLDHYGPSFRVSWACILAFQVLGLTCITGLRLCLKKANRRFETLCDQIDPNNEDALNRLDKDSQRAVLNGFKYIT
ncbi:allantoate permease [Colletotrichum truncatum]|uniref:Allantoate permease n=1 Tax=Colletotrichum truncatum TaxID=5467 RepID=A0ACC3ZLE3_COLTU|nr:allantoate permease [Colletotrichum truncatum]KAF6789962.1 allantoate permease [Colletotrichum truncatum]